MQKPTCAGVGLLLLAVNCGGNGDYTAPDIQEGRGGSSSTTGGAPPATTTGGTDSPVAMSGNGGERGSEAEPVTGGTPAAAGGQATTPPRGDSGEGGATAAPSSGGDVGSGNVGGGGQSEPDTTVSGYVLDTWERPIVDVVVAIDGIATLTNEDGAFSIPDVAPSYRVVVLQSELRRAQIFEGVTSRQLKFLGESVSAPTTLSLILSGMVMNPDGSPFDSDHRAVAAFSADAAQKNDVSSPVTDGGYSLGFGWAGKPRVSGRFSALVWSVDEDGLPASYDGYAVKEATLSGDPEHAQAELTATLELGAVETRTLHGTLEAPADYTGTLDFLVGPVATIEGVTPGEEFSYQIPQGTAELSWFNLLMSRSIDSVREYSRIARVVSDESDELELVVPKAPALALPLDQAVNVAPQTLFQWVPQPDTMSIVHLDVDGFSIDIATSGSAVALPDLSEFGMAYKPGARGSWRVQGLGSAHNPDEAVEFAYSSSRFLEAHGAADIAHSVSRSFTLRE